MDYAAGDQIGRWRLAIVVGDHGDCQRLNHLVLLLGELLAVEAQPERALHAALVRVALGHRVSRGRVKLRPEIRPLTARSQVPSVPSVARPRSLPQRLGDGAAHLSSSRSAEANLGSKLASSPGALRLPWLRLTALRTSPHKLCGQLLPVRDG